MQDEGQGRYESRILQRGFANQGIQPNVKLLATEISDAVNSALWSLTFALGFSRFNPFIAN